MRVKEESIEFLEHIAEEINQTIPILEEYDMGLADGFSDMLFDIRGFLNKLKRAY